MSRHVLAFADIGQRDLAVVGGKGANLGELSRIAGVEVPGGFCVTTEAYREALANTSGLSDLLEKLAPLRVEESSAINDVSARIRGVIESSPIPYDIAEAVIAQLAEHGESVPYAVRSSATAEDLPTASFAGQQDTYLNVIGRDAVLSHISRCWASLFTERAVIYRIQNGIDHRQVYLSVVVQKMVFPDAAGIMFTADPVTSDRMTVSIDASFGLGEALVSGLVDADLYKVRRGSVVARNISAKKLAIYADPDGGTRQVRLDPEHEHAQTLTDEQILLLARTGQRIEDHFGRPQDIEWGLADDRICILQSRPITTLYPIPGSTDGGPADGRNRVYMSMAHQQLMTDVMRPLGISMFELSFHKIATQPTVSAGGRLFLDVSADLSSPFTARTFVRTGLGSADPLIQSALTSLLDRKDYLKTLPRGKSLGVTATSPGQIVRGLLQAVLIYRRNDPELVTKIIQANTAATAGTERAITGRTGDELFDFIVSDFDECFTQVVLHNFGLGIVQFLAQRWVGKITQGVPDEQNAVDVLGQSLSNNVTAQMGLDLLDVADVTRQHPTVLEYLNQASDTTLFDDLAGVDGGPEVSAALRNFLDKYGMRCPGEIDITRTRWAEQPTLLVPLILNNIRNFAPGSHASIFQAKLDEANVMAERISTRLEQSKGRRKARSARRMISVYRNFIGFREYPKYAFMQRFAVYKQALRAEAERLAGLGVLRDPGDADYLTFDEFRQVASSRQVDQAEIDQRKRDERLFQRLTPPRVITSDGEVVTGSYDTADVPSGALVGMPVSSGTVEGRARVVRRLEDARIEKGDILVAAFTDPSWTPLFVTIAGLVCEVGGTMTHGAVVAREYGLPAVVSIENATTLIHDGQRIRVNGTAGYVELLD